VSMRFVTRAKQGMHARRVYSAPTDRPGGVICDQRVMLNGFYAAKDYPEHLRRIRFKDPASGKALVFLTNNTACLPRRSPRCTKAVGRFRISTRVAAVRLTTMPGVGVFSALFVQAEIGSIDRCRSSHALAAYAGLVPTTRSSGGKTAHGGFGKASNRWRTWILVEIVVTLQLAPGPASP
jgi:transposase